MVLASADWVEELKRPRMEVSKVGMALFDGRSFKVRFRGGVEM